MSPALRLLAVSPSRSVLAPARFDRARCVQKQRRRCSGGGAIVVVQHSTKSLSLAHRL
jgi:hypothetical protein